MPIMDDTQRALQLWSLLALAARMQTILTYGEVADLTGLANEHGRQLGYVAFYCMKHDLPLLSSLDVNQETGNPSAAFYRDTDIAAEHRRCFAYDWRKKGVLPTVEQLQDAWDNRVKIEEDYKARRKVEAAAA